MNEMGARIKQRREELNLTMAELGERVNVNASAVNKWEKGYVSDLKRSTIQSIAKALECSPVWLLGWDVTEQEHIAREAANDARLLMKIKKLNDRDRVIVERMIDSMIEAEG